MSKNAWRVGIINNNILRTVHIAYGNNRYYSLRSSDYLYFSTSSLARVTYLDSASAVDNPTKTKQISSPCQCDVIGATSFRL